MNIVTKWFSDLKEEVPIFVQLCRNIIQLLVAKVRKEDSSVAKSKMIELWRKSLKIQAVVGCVVATILCLLMRDGRSSQTNRGVIHADDKALKVLAEQMAQQEKRQEEIAAEQKRTKEKRERDRARAIEAERVRQQKYHELKAWYNGEKEKLDVLKHSAYSNLLKSMSGRAHKILVEKGWPQIKIDLLDGITLAEPIPESLKDFATSRTELPLKEKVFGVFTSLMVTAHDPIDEERSVESLIVQGIKLEGKIQGTVKDVVGFVDKLTAYLDKVFATRYDARIDEVADEKRGNYMCDRHWEGVPRWEAGLYVTMQNGGSAYVRLDIPAVSEHYLPGLVIQRIKDEWRSLIQKHEDEFKARYDKIEREFLRKQQEI